METLKVPTATRWEPQIGYSRAVRIGPLVHVSGTVALNEDGEIVGPGDPYRQAATALASMESALEALGARLDDVFRTRIYLTDIADWQAVGKAHWEAFGEIKPASTLVEVSALIHPDALVELEADAAIRETQ